MTSMMRAAAITLIERGRTDPKPMFTMVVPR
jgi:hypothetical protein